MSDIARGLEAITEFGQKHGIVAAAKEMVASANGQPLASRRKAALFIAGLLGHKLPHTDLKEQPYGYVGQCRNCGQVIKVPREQGDLPPIQGRASEGACPASGIVGA